jgi:hypothetical protein
MIKPLYLILTNERKIRVTCNEATVKRFTELVNREIESFADGSATFAEIRTFAWCAAKEGEALDGRNFTLTEVELVRLMDAHAMYKLAEMCAAMVFSVN